MSERAFEGRPNAGTPLLGAPEGISVIKAGVWLYALSGRVFPVKPGGTAEVFRFCPSNKCCGTGAFFIAWSKSPASQRQILKGEAHHEREQDPLQDLSE